MGKHKRKKSRKNKQMRVVKVDDVANTETLDQTCLKFINENLETAVDSLEFDYVKDRLKQAGSKSGKSLKDAMLIEKTNLLKRQLAEGLLLWQFIRTTFYSWQTKQREYYAEFVAKIKLDPDNIYTQTVLNIEWLPTKAWRKILWQENINFESYESCLRRLTAEQHLVIANNAKDFVEAKQVPRIFSWFDKAFRGISYENLLKSNLDYDQRYTSKGTLSYNLLNLDFGFNAYPGRENDDSKIVEFSPLRFLSTKNHEDDFIVNQEDGRYWRLYKSARSNYVYRPEREVKLKTHICPGFWYTLFVHFLFWIASPICAVIGIEQIADGYQLDLALSSILIPGLLTPSWLLVALIKAFLGFITENDWAEKWIFKPMALLIAGSVLIAILAFVVMILCKAFSLIYENVGLGGVFLLAWPTLLFIASVYLKIKNIAAGRPHSDIDFDDLPDGSQTAWWLVFISGVIMLIIHFWDKILPEILGFINYLALVITSLVTFAGWPLLIFFMIFAIIPISSYWLKRKEVDKMSLEEANKFYDTFNKILTLAMLAVLVSGFGLITYLLYNDHLISHSTTIYLIIIGSVILTALILSTQAKQTTYKLNPQTKRSYEALAKIDPKLFKLSARNEWLQNMEEPNRIIMLSKIYDHLSGRLRDEKDKKHLMRLIVLKLDDRLIDELDPLMKDAVGYHCSDYKLPKVLMLVINGMTATEAIKKLTDDEKVTSVLAWQKFEARNARKKVIGKFFKTIFYPLVKLFEWALTLKRLFELFNKRCPYVAKSKILSN